jgi:hypothetical protein
MTYLFCFVSTFFAVMGADWLNASFTPDHPGRAQVAVIAISAAIGAVLDWRAMRARRQRKAARQLARQNGDLAH